MQEGASPEEKLLKLIRKKNTAAVQGEAPLATGGISTGTLSLVDGFGGSVRVFKTLDKFLIAIIVVLFGYLIYDLRFGKKEEITISLEESISKPEVAVAVINEPVEPPPFSYYAEQIKDRDIFESEQTQRITTDQLPVKVQTVAPPPDLTTKLKIVGVVLDKDPEVIVEDLETQKTYFLHKGDRIREAVVSVIEEGKVIFEYNNQTIELVR